ncbi:murein DD-endopeptidase MepM/ murein hydrolase activator NlpD [Kaistia hirudinis]|uniref:Murein DD-endopeptidase MepM/ murein hydrolase activator NlpD n=1 Tax=Kaistia hirudinis TaxID=1293440 RepID=A0A840ANR2_9HYPH|nr:murein DD-endopeptidase MepM/ murein hydrolase activator NlpD [Kaistia hirudinis]
MRGWGRGQSAGARSGGVDLGTEPALTVGTPDGLPQRRSVSVRWLAGTVLTGLTSTVLMGGALMAALDGRHQLAVPPEIGRAIRSAIDSLGTGQKGDRIRPTQEPVSDRQVLQVSTVSRQGDRDLIKMKPFAKITTALATSITEAGADIPPFDPTRLAGGDPGPAAPTAADKLAEIKDEGTSGDGEDADVASADGGAGSSGDGADQGAASDAPAQEQFYGANVEGEISVKTSDLPLDEQPMDSEPSVAEAEAEAAARATVPNLAAGTVMAAMPYVDPDRFTVADPSSDPFSALGVKIVPENVSFVAKSAPTSRNEERVASIDKGQNFGKLLSQNGVGDQDASAIIAAMSDLVDLTSLRAGQKVRILEAIESDSSVRPMRVSIYDDGVHQATVARRDDDTFVRADEPESSTDEFETAEPAAPDDGPMPKLYDSIYETAREQQVPEQLITELIRIFSYDVDFQSRVAPGDAIEVFHSLPEDGGSDADDEILYASITIDGVTKRFYRYRSPDDGVVDYFDEDGRSAKKFLVRKPINIGILRSPFGYRKHPILGYVRLHPGVDWAAPRGTPILAAGNGVVEKAGWTSGYGRFTLIRHTNGYETAYGHQSGIAKGVVPGAKVRQGQVIGYVGSTGLSTGPHLHYEVRINSKPVDPLRVRLPRGRVLQGEILTAFEKERSRIDTLIGTPAGAKVASIPDDEVTN